MGYFQEFILSLRHRFMTSRHQMYGEDSISNTRVQSSEYMTRDEFNLHKIIVIVTASGKVCFQCFFTVVYFIRCGKYFSKSYAKTCGKMAKQRCYMHLCYEKVEIYSSHFS